MRLVYFGSPQAAVPPLRGLLDAGHEVLAVVTNPPRRRGRRTAPTPTPVAELAEQRGVQVTHDPDEVLALDAELGVVVAFGRIIRAHVLARLPMVNLHFSLLPRWRGAAPVQRAILAGDTETGVCLMEVAEGLDTGGIYACETVPITADSTAEGLTEELSRIGTELLLSALSGPLGEPVPQSDDGITYAEKITPADLELHWEQDATALLRTIAVGGAWTTLHGRRLKVLQARPADADALAGTGAGHRPGELVDGKVVCGSGVLELERLQPEGKPAMDARAFLNGARPEAGTGLGT